MSPPPAYPGRYERDRRQQRGCFIIITGLVVGFLAACTWGVWECLDRLIQGLPLWQMLLYTVALVIVGFVPALFASAALWVLIHNVLLRRGPQRQHPPGRCAIVPLYEQRMESTWHGGAAAPGALLAFHARRLDDLARALGVTPLSALGLDDDLTEDFDEEPVWRDAELGLATVRRLRAAVRSNPDLGSDVEGVDAELALLEEGLARAQRQGVRFCLELRLGLDPRIEIVGVKTGRGSFT